MKKIMAGAPEIVIDLSRRRLRAMSAEWSRNRLRVKRTICETMPGDLDADDPGAVGRWLAGQMKQAGIPGERAVFALTREHVALKRLTLPTTDEVELPDMTRLAMQRDLSFDPDTAVIDYLPLQRNATGTSVLAVAVPQAVLAYTTTLARAAGLKADRVSLRGMGAAVLIDPKVDESTSDASRTLLVDVIGDSFELSVVEDGVIHFSRAAEITSNGNADAFTDSVIQEIRRTWMSYRIVDEDSRVDQALLLGDSALNRDALETVGEMLKVKTGRIEQHARVDANGAAMDGLWPLAGLLLGPILQRETIDFIHPRRAPDVRARKRQIALGLAGILVILAFGAWTMANRTLQPLRQRLETLQSVSGDLTSQYRRYGRDKYRLEHLQQWESTQINWLDHAATLVELMPPRDRVVLDQWTGTLQFRGVQFDHRENRWSTPTGISIVLEGEASDRMTADAFRAALVESNVYSTSSGGSETEGGRRLPFGFTYRLGTNTTEPGGGDENTTPDQDRPMPTAQRDAADDLETERSG